MGNPEEDVVIEAGATVVCGIDDSPAASSALDEAVRTAARRGARVRAVVVYRPAEDQGAWAYGPAAEIPLPDPETYHHRQWQAARQIVDPILARLRGRLTTMPRVDIDAVPGRVVEALVGAATGADALIVGRRGRHAPKGATIGSTTLGCVLHAPCPVTVANEEAISGDGPAQPGVLVVGVDGSASADVALRFAMEEAQRRGAVVHAVFALRPSDAFLYEADVEPDLASLRAAATANLERHIQGLREEFGFTVDARAEAVIGSPAAVLADAARDAELLVAGHRGLGWWRSAVLGFVGLGALLAAPCTVTLVPAPAPAADSPAEPIT